MMLLPEELETEYDRRVDAYQEERKMEYLSSMERRAMERGRQAGLVEGMEQGVLQGVLQGELSGRAVTVQRQLARRLGALSKEDEQRVRSLSVAMLDRLADDLLDFAEPADLQRWFARHVMQ
jgi:flagellar biosynthesis/type III secretory pathway protein FliH